MKGRGEVTAWLWLLAIPRLDDTYTFRQRDQQIAIRATGGELHASSGAPMVHVSVSYPGVKHRIRASGNSLYDAVHKIHNQLWELGYELPFLHEYDPTLPQNTAE